MIQALSDHIDQLDLALDQLSLNDRNFDRFAIMLIDNVVELVLHQHAQDKSRDEETWHRLGKPTFKMSDMIECGSKLRRLGAGAQSMEAAADHIVHYLYEHLRDQVRGQRACALIRFYKTHSYCGIDEELQTFARSLDDGIARNPQTKCLTLLATVGELPA